RRGARLLSVHRARDCDGGSRIAHMRDDRHPSLHPIDGVAQQLALLRVRQAHRLADVHGQRERLGAMREMKVDQLSARLPVDRAVARERGYRCMNEARSEIAHSIDLYFWWALILNLKR